MALPNMASTLCSLLNAIITHGIRQSSRPPGCPPPQPEHITIIRITIVTIITPPPAIAMAPLCTIAVRLRTTLHGACVITLHQLWYQRTHDGLQHHAD
jgi:hypothetical protein